MSFARRRRPAAPALLFLTTFSSEAAAKRFAKQAVAARYAACVNVWGPVRSFFHWKGKLHSDKEFVALGKTTQGAFKKLKRDIKKLHTYEVPELIALKISDGLPAYLEWIASAI